MATQNHGFNDPVRGTEEWHIPLNQNFDQQDTAIEVRDVESDLNESAPRNGAKFFATDTERVWLGNGTDWLAADTFGPTPTYTSVTTDDVVIDTTVTIAGNETWHEGNDGNNSGLDADLLDGEEGAFYARDDEFIAHTDDESNPHLTELNQLSDAESLSIDDLAERPSAGEVGRLYIAPDSNTIYYDDGDTWVNVGEAGSAANSVSVSDDDSAVVTDVDDINFGSELDVTNDGDDTVTIDFAGGADTLDGESPGFYLDHDNFTNVQSDAHHTKYTDSEAVDAVNAESELSVDISGDADTVDGANVFVQDTEPSGWADGDLWFEPI